ncbi:tRNA 2-thiocytidine biosynthesis TtcA family protein [Clostridium grantii]|uniref:tRNA(Ile)-lysidine synthase TilS/MesJ n=1 Tax=Clostridium grantii DSM 8605 TaxID=1121316 RepID=A0A1M5UPJ6_9CLOT|nr:tRNA 2-thiocytidine biosynthesis TtcA family protein [Clostridium grantii]SHH64982.1 tRNA(Ile)-lysidine synthase TilS/MesJ [Clostridium grantii DSM 8605]
MSNLGGSGCELLVPVGERKPLNEIERSIVKTYSKPIWSKFVKALKDFELIEEGDKIAIAISGGKDSMLMAKLFQQLKMHRKFNFELEFIAMDPGFHESNRELLKSNCEYLNIPVKIFESGIFDVVGEIAKDYPCYMCARMRRGFLYSKALELGCNKLALGHHFDDVIETTMLNVLYSGSFKTMKPKLKSKNFEGLELIRPMFYIHEDDVKRYTINSGIGFMNCGCIVAAGKTSSKRSEIKTMIKDMKKNFSDVDKCIFQAANNVNLDSILGWEQGGKKYSFLDTYDDEN